MERYQIRVLQPVGGQLADELASFMRGVIGDAGHVRTREFPSNRYDGHHLVYLDLIPTTPDPVAHLEGPLT
ncbi:hypothetical protein [Stackebrandtia soli]|uniref:hypothetical protein n=1 Tax=Stackebrandtia soli TaxID=1892856 RepID=UPI0039ED4B6A